MIVLDEQWSVRDVEIASKKIKALRIEFIASGSFSEPTAELEILGDYLFGTGLNETNVKPSKAPDLPSHLARLCEAQLLTPDEEKSVFHRMNYLRFRAEGLKKNSDLNDSWNLKRIECLLKAADRREKFIIRARFSLGGHRRIQTLQRLADKLGVSKERIRQLEKRALDKLRGMSEAITLPDA